MALHSSLVDNGEKLRQTCQEASFECDATYPAGKLVPHSEPVASLTGCQLAELNLPGVHEPLRH